MDLRGVVVEPVATRDEKRYRELMGAHHFLGALPKIGETLWYVGRWRGAWVALIGFSAPALKCAAREHGLPRRELDLRRPHARLPARARRLRRRARRRPSWSSSAPWTRTRGRA